MLRGQLELAPPHLTGAHDQPTKSNRSTKAHQTRQKNKDVDTIHQIRQIVARNTAGQCIVCTRGIRIVCTRGTGSSLHAGLFCPGSFVHAVLTAMHKKGQGR